MTTSFLRALQPVDLRTRPAKVAQRFLAIKGYSGVRSIGVIQQGENWYFYYDLPDGLLELEISRDSATGDFTRTVVGLVTDHERLAEYLGR